MKLISRQWAKAVILSIGVFLGVWAHSSMLQSGDPLTTLVDEASEDIRSGDWLAAKGKAGALERLYEEYRWRMELEGPARRANDIRLLIALLIEDIRSEEAVSAGQHLVLLKEKLKRFAFITI